MIRDAHIVSAFVYLRFVFGAVYSDYSDKCGYDREGFVCHASDREHENIVYKNERASDQYAVSELLRVGKREAERVYNNSEDDEEWVVILPWEKAHSACNDREKYRYPLSAEEFFVAVGVAKISHKADDVDRESQGCIYQQVVHAHAKNAYCLNRDKLLLVFELIGNEKYCHGDNADDLTEYVRKAHIFSPNKCVIFFEIL